jgi:hypothetical protein
MTDFPGETPQVARYAEYCTLITGDPGTLTEAVESLVLDGYFFDRIVGSAPCALRGPERGGNVGKS